MTVFRSALWLKHMPRYRKNNCYRKVWAFNCKVNEGTQKNKYPWMCVLSTVELTDLELHLLFHLLGIVFNLISSQDDFIRSAVQLVWDDPLEVLEHNKETG